MSLNNFASPRWQDEEEGEEDQEEGEEDQEEWNGWEDSAATASLRRLHHMPALRSLCLGGCTLTSLTWLQVRGPCPNTTCALWRCAAACLRWQGAHAAALLLLPPLAAAVCGPSWCLWVMICV